MVLPYVTVCGTPVRLVLTPLDPATSVAPATTFGLDKFVELHVTVTGHVEAFAGMSQVVTLIVPPTRFALHDAFVPPFEPLQLQLYVPSLPVESVHEGLPTLQRFVAGVDENEPPFEVPHTPFTGAAHAAELFP